MKKIKRLFIPIFCVLTVIACTQSSQNDERFVKTYLEILITRERFADSAVANPKVREIMNANGFTQESFKAQFNELSRNPDRFRHTIDSVRALAGKIIREEQGKTDSTQKKP